MDGPPKRKNVEEVDFQTNKRAKTDKKERIEFLFAGFIFALISLAFSFGFRRVDDSIYAETGWVELSHEDIPFDRHILFPVAAEFELEELLDVSRYLFTHCPQRALLPLYFSHFMAETEGILNGDTSRTTYIRVAVYTMRVFYCGVVHYIWWVVNGVVIAGIFSFPTALLSTANIFYYCGAKFFNWSAYKFLDIFGKQPTSPADKHISAIAKVNLVHIYTAFTMVTLTVIVINVVLSSTYTILEFLNLIDKAESSRMCSIIKRQVYQSALQSKDVTQFRADQDNFTPTKSQLSSISSSHARKVRDTFSSHERDYISMHTFNETKKLEVLEKFPLGTYSQQIASEQYSSVYSEVEEVLLGEDEIAIETSTFASRQGLDLGQIIAATENTIESLPVTPVKAGWWTVGQSKQDK